MKLHHSPFLTLQFRDFRLLWFGLFASQMAIHMQIVAINWHIYELTNSAISLGLIGLVSFLAILIFSLPGGIAADRFDRKKLMLVSLIFLTLISSLLTTTTKSAVISPLFIYAAVCLTALIQTFDLPARQSVVPSLVPQQYFMNAVSLNTMIRQASIVIGPAIAGFLIAFYGVASVYFVAIIGFTLSIFTLLPITIPKRSDHQRASFTLTSLLEGIHFVRKTPMIYATMLLDFFATFFSSAMVLLPIFVKDILHTGPQTLGLLYAAPSIGGVIAGLLFSSLKKVTHQGKLILISVFLYGVATIGFGFSRSFYLAFFFLFLLGTADMISTIIRNTIRQLMTPDILRGRMVSINQIFFMGGPQLGEAEAGFLAAAISAPASVIVGGVGTIVAVVAIALLVPALRKYQGHEVV